MTDVDDDGPPAAATTSANVSGLLPAAVVFDFDGLLCDTETPIYETARAALAELGHDLTVPAWATVIGHGDDDGFAQMCRALGAAVDRAAYEARYLAQDRSGRDLLPVLPGATELLDELAAAGVPCGVASSSPLPWVDGHLTRLGLRDRFAAVATRDRVGGRAKPAPDSYLLACADLGVDPAGCVAVEDSAPGIAAAHAAGLVVVAVPSTITAHTNLSAADATVPSLVELTVADLRALVTPGDVAGEPSGGRP